VAACHLGKTECITGKRHSQSELRHIILFVCARMRASVYKVSFSLLLFFADNAARERLREIHTAETSSADPLHVACESRGERVFWSLRTQQLSRHCSPQHSARICSVLLKEKKDQLVTLLLAGFTSCCQGPSLVTFQACSQPSSSNTSRHSTTHRFLPTQPCTNQPAYDTSRRVAPDHAARDFCGHVCLN
jgi:hypothetical protein